MKNSPESGRIVVKFDPQKSVVRVSHEGEILGPTQPIGNVLGVETSQ